MATPSNAQIATTHNWLASSAAYNLLKPTIDEKQYKAYGDEDITGLIEVMGSKNVVRSLKYRHFEDSRLHTTVRATGTSGGANTNVVYTVDAAYTMAGFPTDFDPYNAASFGGLAPNPSGTTTLHPVRKNQTVIFPDNTRGTVLSRTATTFTVMPDVEGASLPTVTNTEDIVLGGIVAGEGDTAPEGVNSRQDVYDNVLQILHDSAEATGTALGEKTWVKYEGLDGKMGNVWYYKNQKDTLRRFKNSREMDMVAGEAVTNTTNLAAVDATILKTEGLYTFAASVNGATPYSIAGGISLEDFNDMIIDSLDANEGARENAVMASIRLRDSIDGFIRPEMQAGGVVYNTFSGGKDQSIKFGFSSFESLGYTFHLKTYKLLNNPTLLGKINDFKHSGLVLPLDKRAYSIGESKIKEEVGSFRMNCMVDREMEEWMTGGTNGIYNTKEDRADIHFRSQFGFEGFGPNRFNLLQGEA